MRTQKRVKNVKEKSATSLPSGEVKGATAPAFGITDFVPTPPEIVLREALEEPDRRLLEEYAESIRVLRDQKRFTYREIAEWLQEYGVECDHNSVYREYVKGLTEEQEMDAALRDAEDEKNGRE
jgi:hypothetical protein